MGSVGGFDRRVTALRESQRSMVPRPRHVVGLAGIEPLPLGPVMKGAHSGRDLRGIDCDHPFQIVDLASTPPIDLRCRQPSDAHQDVDRRDEMALGQGRLGRIFHPIFELAANHSDRTHQF